MSIFLSCILVKICFYGLIRIYLLIGGEIVIMPFIFFCGLCIFDLTLRLAIQTDLKAITAYGSVLHVNLLIILFLLDTNFLNSGLIFYIWGHSYATAGIFFAINLIERSYGSRSTFEISGVYTANPIVGLVSIFAVITFLEFPLTFFFGVNFDYGLLR
jgi:multicomponent Na+:H+ antiporter subunit A